MIFPAHDYKGETVSTIGEEKAFNPRLQVKSVDQYVELMNNLNLPNPQDDGRRRAGQHARRPGPGRDRAARLGGERGRGLALDGSPTWRSSICASGPNARSTADPGLAARALPRACGQCPSGRDAVRARPRHRQAPYVLLRLRRALGDGGAGGAGRRAHLGLPYPGRHRCLEEGRAARSCINRSLRAPAIRNPASDGRLTAGSG